MPFANFGRGGAESAGGLIEPTLLAVLSAINCRAWTGCRLLGEIKQRYFRPAGHGGHSLRRQERRRLLNERFHQLSTAMHGTTLLDRMTANPPPPVHPWVGAKAGQSSAFVDHRTSDRSAPIPAVRQLTPRTAGVRPESRRSRMRARRLILCSRCCTDRLAAVSRCARFSRGFGFMRMECTVGASLPCLAAR
jgi:hypothetical protein